MTPKENPYLQSIVLKQSLYLSMLTYGLGSKQRNSLVLHENRTVLYLIQSYAIQNIYINYLIISVFQNIVLFY